MFKKVTITNLNSDKLTATVSYEIEGFLINSWVRVTQEKFNSLAIDQEINVPEIALNKIG